MELVINGRFLGRPPTGVDRSAFELTRSLGELESVEGISVSAAVPPGTADRAMAELDGIVGVQVVGRDLPGHLWEQAHLARFRPDAWLLGFCNTGPVLRRRQAVLIHDAQFRTQPDSYSRAFRLTYSVLVPALSRRAAQIFTVSQYSRATLERERIVPPGKLGLLPNGTDHLDRVVADPAVLERHQLTTGRYFLVVGSLAPHKNLATLYEAVTSAEDLTAPLVVVGSADPRVLRASQVADSTRIQPVGRVTDAELKALYEGAIALCLPSLTEGFGLSAVEAMRCGTPVLAADAGALPEVCGDAARLVAPTDPAAWARQLVELEADAERRAALRRRGLDCARSLEWRHSAITLLQTLRSAGPVPSPHRSGDAGGRLYGAGRP